MFFTVICRTLLREFTSNNDSRVLIFVKTREAVSLLCESLNTDDALKAVGATCGTLVGKC